MRSFSRRLGRDGLPSLFSMLPAFLDVVIRVFLFVGREEFRGLDFESRTDFENRGERWAPLAGFDQADGGTVEAGELSEFFLGYVLGFAFFLENPAKNLFFLHSCLMEN